MTAVLWLAAGFGAIVLVGTVLTAIHDAVAHAVEATRIVAVPARRPSRTSWPHQSVQLEGGATPSARSKMYATAASNPAGRVSRWRTPGMLR
jgi:hypothetical protein